MKIQGLSVQVTVYCVVSQYNKCLLPFTSLMTKKSNIHLSLSKCCSKEHRIRSFNNYRYKNSSTSRVSFLHTRRSLVYFAAQ